jgi:hypothetical protein
VIVITGFEIDETETPLSLIIFHVAPSNTDIFQSVEEDGQITSQAPPPPHHSDLPIRILESS